MHRATSCFIDASRWIAACLVVISHLRSVAFANYDTVSSHALPVIALYFLCSLGHAAVIVFFVISGYLVGGRTLMRALRAPVSLIEFASHRIARIYVVLAPALLIGYAFDWIGLHFIDRSGLYTNQAPWHIWSLGYDVSSRLTLWSLMGNLFMMQTIAVEPLGSNGALWSLANEWWYYVVFGLGLILLSPRSLPTRCTALVLGVCLLVLLPVGLSLWFLVWAVGVVAAFIDERWQGIAPPVALGMLAAVCVCVHPTTYSGPLSIVPDLALAAAYSLALLSAKRLPLRLCHPIHRWLASFSYSTYLIHFPAMLLALAAMNRVFHRGIAEQPSLPSVAAAGGMVMLIYGLAWGFSRLTEARTEQCRLAVLTWCGQPHRSPRPVRLGGGIRQEP
jgi:peptidoglycan/LPS O-acetylase OafA/YrhL